MNSLEVRTRIVSGITRETRSGEYGEVTAVDRVSPEPGKPVQLRVTLTDPSGSRTFLVSIEEL